MKVIVNVPEAADRRWKAWRKLLESVDTSKTNGYAFIGDWLALGRKAEVEIGSYVLVYDETGSAKHHSPNVSLQQIKDDGSWEIVKDSQGEIKTSGWSWSLDLRDRIATIINAPKLQEITIKFCPFCGSSEVNVDGRQVTCPTCLKVCTITVLVLSLSTVQKYLSEAGKII